jgi:pimeloyl-ACP methyl ester carboxylesterase
MTASAPRDPGRPVGLTGGGVHVVAHTGAEPRIVLIHGAMDRSTSFGRVARHLSDLAVVRYDRRGYGRSRELGPTDLAGHLDDLVAVVGDGPVLLVGHSVGGVIALAAPAVLPGVVGVVATGLLWAVVADRHRRAVRRRRRPGRGRRAVHEADGGRPGVGAPAPEHA